MEIILIALIVLALFLIIHGIAHAGDAQARKSVTNYILTSDRIMSAADSQSIKKVRDSIERLDFEYSKTRVLAGDSCSELHAEDRRQLSEHLHDLEQEKWEKRADGYLQEFADSYMAIVEGDFENFRNVDGLFRAKSRCIALWQKYYSIDLSEYETTIYPKRHMREWFGEDYDPCMESHEALEKKLSACVDKMRPEYKRKTALYDLVVARVASCGTIARSELMKQTFDGYIPDEIRCCYAALIKSNRLSEVKIGGRYFVSLSDKEIAKRDRPKAQKEEAMITSRDKLVHDAVLRHLMDEGAEYIDMTHKGGGLYFFSEDIAQELKEKGYKIEYAKNGSHSTGSRPAWFLRI